MNISIEQVRTLLEKVPNILNKNSVIEISPGCDKFDGYNSYIYRVTIKNLPNDTINTSVDKQELVLKCAPEDEHYRRLMTSEIIYRSEILFYSQLLPEFYKLQNDINTEIFPIIPRYITSVTTPRKEILVLEDVRQFGYNVRDKKLFLDEEHLSFAIKAFAKMNAFSFALMHKNPAVYINLVTSLKEIHGYKHCNVRDEFNSWYQPSLKQLMGMFQSPKDLWILEKLQDIKDNLEDYMENIYEYKGKFGVFSHMDCWTNNMLFKYKNTKLESICFLDFQYAYVVSPVVDFVYLFYVTGKPKEYPKFNNYKTLFYKTLTETLNLLGLDINNVYPRHVFNEELVLYGKYGFFRGLMGVPLSMRNDQDIIDVKDVVDQGLEGYSAFGVENWGQECADWMKKLAIHCIEQKFI